jgi:hypothetical protein
MEGKSEQHEVQTLTHRTDLPLLFGLWSCGGSPCRFLVMQGEVGEEGPVNPNLDSSPQALFPIFPLAALLGALLSTLPFTGPKKKKKQITQKLKVVTQARGDQWLIPNSQRQRQRGQEKSTSKNPKSLFLQRTSHHA